MNNFEQDLKRLEELSSAIKQSDISLEDALKDFEEGIKLAKGLEKTLDKIEAKVQILMNSPELEEEPSDDTSEEQSVKKPRAKKNEQPVLDLFTPNTEIIGTRS
ncbi:MULTISPECIES: exodeoxyribonuclease VII small subunit [Treponema]|uniref:Exodeoxyribonuclease 7 small subunit n=1 Tax=Treponema rectale TaxID=744512 RepID=A0A840SBB9_9SPIR|nr:MULTISPECIES: exodeoxyribonuclease VII small subunit [Treponema]MBB5218124.1 exodeoxyribonuclease VII small subunit [Treponema rectale]MBE6354618.1 exodeoxyribonuclease VII small subunit [Treponema sp.]MBO6177483.1 exodeoxyribonuclease VII small subunit [Treponema sp.]QOS40166.1 exodeoxyribonuclease VII small subunit [Treponema rectale]